jgi:hypothetical protein
MHFTTRFGLLLHRGYQFHCGNRATKGAGVAVVMEYPKKNDKKYSASANVTTGIELQFQIYESVICVVQVDTVAYKIHSQS